MENKILVFTDGSYIKSYNSCGYGVYFPNGEFRNISRRFKRVPLTNQRAELYAIYKAIKTIQKKSLDYSIKIYTDSEYSIKSLTIWIKDWKKKSWKSSTGKDVMNQDLIKKIDEIILKNNGQIEFQHVRSHTGKKDFESINNDIVDKLAKDGGKK
jgi:ribonuclease HI